jgi:putative Mn2+ efflux pump MntP
MDIITIILIAVALAMDAFAVAVTVGLTLKSITLRQRFRLSWHFGLFQSLMPLLGWSCGTHIYRIIEKYDHWVAFALLLLVGLHMIREFFSNNKEYNKAKDPTKGCTLILLSLSTSIDAFAVGITISIIEIKILLTIIIIGTVALLFTLVGMELGSKASCNQYMGKYAQVIGGCILIIIGLNILCKDLHVY